MLFGTAMTQRSGWLTDHVNLLRFFPGSDDQFVALATESEEFRLLCEEFQLAQEALHRFEKAGEIASMRCRDYRCIVHDLERELAAMLADRK